MFPPFGGLIAIGDAALKGTIAGDSAGNGYEHQTRNPNPNGLAVRRHLAGRGCGPIPPMRR